MTLDLGSWGYRHNIKIDDVIKIESLIEEVVVTVSCGGNILINVGPTSDGIIPLIFEERLRQLGQWLNINGEAIYSTSTWKIQTDPLIANITWYTMKNNSQMSTVDVYVILLKPPSQLVDKAKKLKLQPNINCGIILNVSMLGVIDSNGQIMKKSLNWTCNSMDSTLDIDFANFPFNSLASSWAWVLDIQYKL